MNTQNSTQVPQSEPDCNEPDCSKTNCNETNCNMAMILAAKDGDIDTVKLMMSKNVDKYDVAMEQAANNGHMDIVQLLLSTNKINKINYAMYAAAGGGHMDIVQFMINKGVGERSSQPLMRPWLILGQKIIVQLWHLQQMEVIWI